MKITNLYNQIVKNNISTNLLLILIILYPISIVAGPALVEISILVTIIISFLVYKQKIIKYFISINYIKVFLFFYVTIIISSILSDNILISLKSSFFSIRFFLFSVIILIVIKNIKYFNKFFFLICLVFLLICIIDAYIQLIFGKNIFLFATSEKYVTGLFFEEKKLGRYLITFSPILVGLYLSLYKENIKSKLIKSFFFLNIIFLINFFKSKKVLIFFFIFTIFVTLLYAFKKSKKYILLIILPVLIFFGSYSMKISDFNQTVDNTIVQITENKSFSYPSAQHRAFVLTSYKLFKKYPITGIGPNNYRHKCKEIVVDNINNCSTHPHNVFFKF